MVGPIAAGVRTQQLDAPAPVQEETHRGSVLAASVAAGVAGGVATAIPAAFGHGLGPKPLLFAGAAALAGAGVGALGMVGARAIDGDDARRGGALLAGGGVLAGIGGLAMNAALRGHGPRDIGVVAASLGTLGIVGGTAAAGTTLVDEVDAPGANNALLGGAATGVVATAAGVGMLAAAGVLRRAPVADQVAATIIHPSAAVLESLTPAAVKSEFTARSAAAQAAHEALPARTDDAWRDIGKGRSFLRGVATPDEIRSTMGSVVREPRRLFVGVDEAATPQERVDLMMERFDAVGGTKFGTIHVIPPTATGDTTEMAPLVVEHATRGDVLTMMTQTTNVEPVHAFDDVPMATETLELALRAIKQRLDALPPDAPRPKVELSALCLGALPAIELMKRNGGNLATFGVDHEVLLAPPALWREARKLAGRLDRGGPDGLLARSREQLLRLTDADAATPHTTVAVNRKDPLRVGLQSLVVPFHRDEGRPFIPIVSAINSFKDWLQPRELRAYREAAHELEATAGPALNHGMGLGLDRSKVEAIEQAGVRFTVLREMASEARKAAATPE